MENEYFYLVGKEQKGPFTKDQLKTAGLKPDTLVWTEGFENWKPFREVKELKEVLNKTQPPPPPIIDNSPSSTIIGEKEILNSNKIIVGDTNFKIWATVKIYATVFLVIAIIILLAFLLSENKKQKMKEEISTKVNNIMNGRTVVLDGIDFLTEGVLKETGYVKKSRYIDTEAKNWWERNTFYTIYIANNVGFTIKQLTRKRDDCFDLETINSGDMGYTKPAFTFIHDEAWDGNDVPIKTSGGSYSANYRLSVADCYKKAFEYFTIEDKISPGAYSPGKYVEITNFPDMRNEYFYMANATDKHSLKGFEPFPSTWESKDDHIGCVKSDNWVVYFKNSGKHYEITENFEAINNDLLKYLLIPIAFFLIILLLTLLSKPRYFRNLNLYDKRWSNTSHQEHVFIFEHLFFDKFKFSEIIEENVARGVLKITNKGNILNLSYPNTEKFYKIEKVDTDNLTLTSLKDESSISFTRSGAKPTKE